MIFYDPIYISVVSAALEEPASDRDQVPPAAATIPQSSTSPLAPYPFESPALHTAESPVSEEDQGPSATIANYQHQNSTSPLPSPPLVSPVLHPLQSSELAPLESLVLPAPQLVAAGPPASDQDQGPEPITENDHNFTTPLPLGSPALAPPEILANRPSEISASGLPVAEQTLSLPANIANPQNLLFPLPPSPPTSPPFSPKEFPIVSPPSFAMAANIPAKVKAADLTRFIIRAGQLETVKPVVAYWCEYWIVNQILSKELHQGDSDTMAYTLTLMDKLEQVKASNPDNDAIIDDVAGQAYVEQFALETFQRADRAVQANKVTKQTADTFQAAATFFELIHIWNPPDAETQSKIKYAKWNAVRIVKALKEGKDPNESNPKQPEPEENLPELDPNDPEVLDLGEAPKPRQASVEEVPDEQDRVEQRLARQSSIDQSLHPSAQVSARGSPAPPPDPYPRDEFPYTVVQDDNVSPLEPSPPNDRNGSVGGGYFPEVPTFEAGTPNAPHPTAAAGDVHDLGLPDQPSFNPSTRAPEDFQSFLPPNVEEPPFAPPQDFYTQAPPPPAQPHVHYAPPVQPPPQFQPPPQQYQTPQQHFAPPPAAVQQPIRKDQLNTDDVAIAKAQKHARWAISALNFEDAETAVRELRDALKTLGAS